MSTNKWQDLGDKNNRFEYRQLTDDNLYDFELGESIRSTIEQIDPPATKAEGNIRENLYFEDKNNALLIRDKLAGSTVALTAYGYISETKNPSINENDAEEFLDSFFNDPEYEYKLEHTIGAKYKAFVVKDGKVDLSKVSENDAEAKRLLGLNEEAKLGPTHVPDIKKFSESTGSHYLEVIKPDVIRNKHAAAYTNHPADIPERPNNLRGTKALIAHDATLNQQIIKMSEQIQEKSKALSRMDQAADNTLLDHAIVEKHQEEAELLRKEIDSLKKDAFETVIHPERMVWSNEGLKDTLIPSDGVDLTNAWSSLKDDETVPLNDIEGKFSIGKVDPELQNASNNIRENEKITGSIRLINEDNGKQYNLYSIEADGNEVGKETGWVIINEKAGWLRIDEIVDGKPIASNKEAMDKIGLKMHQVPMGPGESEHTKMSVSPEQLRRNISEGQRLAFEKTFKPENERVQEVTLSNYVGKTGASSYWANGDIEEARYAAAAESSISLKQLPEEKLKMLNQLQLIGKPEGADIVGAINGWVVDKRGSSGNNAEVFGQVVTSSKTSGDKTVDEYIVRTVIHGDNKGKLISRTDLNATDYLGKDIDLSSVREQQSLYASSEDPEINKFKGDVPRVKDQFSREHVLSESATPAYKTDDIAAALIRNGAKYEPDYENKTENMFGLGQKHEAIVRFETELEAKPGAGMIDSPELDSIELPTQSKRKGSRPS